MAAADNNDDWRDADFLSFAGRETEENDDDESNNDEMEDKTSNFTPPPPPPPQRRRSAAVAAPYTSRLDINPFVRLHNDIVEFCSLIEPKKKELEERDELVKEFRSIAHECFGKDNCQVLLFGSQATGLLLPTSDVDMVILLKDEEGKDDSKSKKQTTKKRDSEEMENWEVTDDSSKSPLQRLATALREAWIEELEYLEVIERTRVPLVKLTIRGLSMDVCFNQENGPKAAQLMKTYLQAMPPLRPLTFVLKYFLASRGLNEPYLGGIGSYLLQLMIVSFLQHRERYAYNFQRPSVYNLGCLLLEFFELYGMDMNYLTTGISVRHDGFYFPKGAQDRRENYYMPSRPFSLAVENPLDPTMDVGKGSFKIQTIQRSFNVAFNVLLGHVAHPAIPVPSILASILPTSSEMQLRTDAKQSGIKKVNRTIDNDDEDAANDMQPPQRKRQRRV